MLSTRPAVLFDVVSCADPDFDDSGCDLSDAGSIFAEADSESTGLPSSPETGPAAIAQIAEVLHEVPDVALNLGIECLSPELVQKLVKDGTCVLIDVRGADRDAGTIAGAVHVPAVSSQQPFVSRLPGLVDQHRNARLVVFFCHFSRHRAPFCANLWRKVTDEAGNSSQGVALMAGGFRAWQKMGLPVQNKANDSEQFFADSLALKQGQLLQQNGRMHQNIF